jgi:hypothetical protein
MKKSKIMMIIGSLLLGSLFYFPIWKITLLAPQYPEPLALNIHIDHLSDGVQFNDVNNIDLLNHYIGMAHLPTPENVKKGLVEAFLEFTIFPFVIGGMVILGLIFGFIGNPKLYITWWVIMMAFGLFGLYDFYSWLYVYGHELDPNAILKITDPLTGEPMGYQPPFFGYKKILNFEVYSYPEIGAYLMASGMFLSFFAFFVGKKEIKK